MALLNRDRKQTRLICTCKWKRSYKEWIVNENISLAVKICYEECENDIGGKEAIDNVVDYEKHILLVAQKCKLKRADPGWENNKNDQEPFPSPEMKNIEWETAVLDEKSACLGRVKRSSPVQGTEWGDYVSSKFGCVVDTGSKTRDEDITREEAIRAANTLSKFIHTEEL